MTLIRYCYRVFFDVARFRTVDHGTSKGIDASIHSYTSQVLSLQSSNRLIKVIALVAFDMVFHASTMTTSV